MTKKPTKKTTKRSLNPKKRGRKPDRLIITQDPEVALALLLRPRRQR